MRRIPVFFPSGACHLYGVIFAPDVPDPRGLGIVLCPPFADEAIHSHRVLIVMARRLAAAGLAAFLIDYAGTGDSEGRFEDGTLDRYVEDILAAAAYLQGEMGVARCGLLGLRLGANLATRASARRPSLSPLMLWAPVVDVPGYFRRWLRLRLFTELSTTGRRTTTVRALEERLGQGEPVDVVGYSVSPAMAEQFRRADPYPQPGRWAPTLVVPFGDGTGEEAAGTRITDESRGPLTVCPIRDGPFWDRARAGDHEALCRVTLDWVFGAEAE